MGKHRDILVQVMRNIPYRGLALYGGAVETPAKEFPLNLHERLAFWFGSWDLRRNREWNPNAEDVHGVFTHAFSRGYPVLGASLGVARTPELNPFPRNSFRDRVNLPTEDAKQELVHTLGEPVSRYTDEKEYGIRKKGGPVELLWFMNYSMKRMSRQNRCTKFAKQLELIIKGCSLEHDAEKQRTLF